MSNNILDKKFESMEKMLHSHLNSFANTCTLEQHLHLHIVYINRHGTLLQFLQLIKNCSQVISGDKTSLHGVLHLTPSANRCAMSFSYFCHNAIPPTQSITIKLRGSKLNLPIFSAS